jgi:diguanylate cyclase (GGDEF)-like protein/PAS domain S-box-containing protein
MQRPATNAMDKPDDIGDAAAGVPAESSESMLALLEREHDFLKTLIGTLPDLIWLKDAEGVYLACNPEFERFVGRPEAQIVGRADYDLFPRALADSFREHDRLAMTSDAPTTSEQWIPHAGTSQRVLLETTKTPMRDGNGALVGVLGIAHDITRRHADTESIRASEEKLRGLYELAPLGIALVDMEGRFVQFNAAFEAICGYPADELLALDYWTLTPEKYAADEQRQLESLARTGSYGPYEKEYRRKDGTLVPISLNGRLVTGADGKQYIWSIVEDITERKRVESELRQAASVFHHANEGIMVTAADGTILDVNATFSRITGYARDEVVGRNPRILKSGRHDEAYYAALWHHLQTTGYWSGETWNRRKNGEVYPELQTISAIRNEGGAIQRYVALFSDISALKEHQRQLEHIAHYDALTQLPNRVLLADRLHQAMTQAARRGSIVIVAYLDLDGFKRINDLYGHDLGDRLLVVLAARMKEVLREGDTLARIGGDEFVAILPDMAAVTACEPIIRRLLAAAGEPAQIDAVAAQVSASIGVAVFPQADDIEADQLMRQADQAMYLAKQTGKNRFHIFDAAQDQEIRQRHESIDRIGEALGNGELRLHFQPKLNLRSGAVVGAEALIRWQHPGRGLLGPGEFLPLIENDVLIERIGEWTIEAALLQMEAWHAEGLSVPVSVNASSRQLQAEGFPDALRAALARHPAVAHLLELEVVESSAIDDIAAVSGQMQRCRALGVGFAIDDFGTGYSSLTYLKRLPASVLKVDQSFVRGMLVDPDDLAIVEGVLGLATAFGRTAIAEGVETAAHCEVMLRLGCELAQGYAIARPMAGDAFLAWVRERHGTVLWRTPARLDRLWRPALHALVEHQAWVRHLGHYLRDAHNVPPPLDAQGCGLGQWLQRASAGDAGVLDRLQALHEESLRVAVALAAQKQAGHREAALAGLPRVEALRDAISTEIERLLDGASDAPPPGAGRAGAVR